MSTKKPHVCTIPGCKARFSRPNRLKTHLLKHSGQRPYVCDEKDCDKSYTNQSHLRRHKRTFHDKQNVNLKIFRCTHEGCRQELANLFSLKRHYKRVHESHTHFCEFCSKGFKRKNQLKTHLYEHTGIAPFPCPDCPCKFTAYAQLAIHKRRHKTYKCQCGEIFSRWSIYCKHQRESHPKEHKCDKCAKTFRHKPNYKMHLLTHDEIREALECPYDGCSRLYYAKKNLVMHIKVFHLKTAKFVRKPKPKAEQIRIKKAKQTRKDKGKCKKSRALYLAGLTGSYEVEKAVLAGIPVDVENPNEIIDCSDVESNFDETCI